MQISDTVNQLFAEESGIGSDCMLSDEAMTSMEPNAYDAFFHENQLGQCRPRSVLADTEPLVIDDVLRSSHGNFYAPN